MIFFDQDDGMGGMGGDEAEEDTDPTTFGGFGDQDEDRSAEAAWKGVDQSALDYQSQLEDRALNAGAQPYGQNAAARWQGTPAIGLSMFKPRTPDLVTTFNQKGIPKTTQRIDASTQMATPPEGLIGGKALESALAGGPASSLTPEAQWRRTFGGTSINPGTPGAPVTPRAPVLSRMGTGGAYKPSYTGGTTGAGYAY